MESVTKLACATHKKGIQDSDTLIIRVHIKFIMRGVNVKGSRHFAKEEAKEIGEAIGIDWSKVDFEQFRMGLEVELEHGKRDPQTDVTHDDPVMTGKIALAHLKELPDYYTRLAKMERESE